MELAVPTTAGTGVGIEHRERNGGDHAPDDERSREERLGGRAPARPPSLPLALHGSDGDAGSEVLDADAEAEAEAAAAAAAEAAAFDCTEEWGGDAGVDSGGGASVDPYRAAGNDGTASTSPWAAAQGDGSDGEEAELQRPPGSDPGAASARAPASPTWLCRGCGHADTQFGDPVTLQCEHRAGRQAGCCWHIEPPRSALSRGTSSSFLTRGTPARCTGVSSLPSAEASWAATTTQKAASTP